MAHAWELHTYFLVIMSKGSSPPSRYRCIWKGGITGDPK